MASLIKEIEDLCEQATTCIHNAYAKGFEQGFHDGEEALILGSHEYFRGYEDGKRQGMNDAWECARKLRHPSYEGGLRDSEKKKIFDCISSDAVLTNFSASEAIKKINEYEKEQIPKVKVGDELEHKGKYLVITWINDENIWNGMLLNDGEFGERGQVYSAMKGFETWKPTGKHYPLPEILEKMKAESEVADE